MCQPARCRTCQKTTWTGCGQHVDSVMQGVARTDRCSCEGGPPSSRKGYSHPPKREGFLASLFSRGS